MACPGKRDRFEIADRAVMLQEETALCYRMQRAHIAAGNFRQARVWQLDGQACHEAMTRELRELTQ